VVAADGSALIKTRGDGILEPYPKVEVSIFDRPTRVLDGPLVLTCHVHRNEWPLSSNHGTGRMRFAFSVAGDTVLSNDFLVKFEEPMPRKKSTAAVVIPPPSSPPVSCTPPTLSAGKSEAQHGVKRSREEQ